MRAGYVAALLLVVMIAATGVGVLHLINRRTNQVTYSYANTARRADKVRLDVERLLAATRQYVTTDHDADRARVLAIRKQIATVLESLSAEGHDTSKEVAALQTDLRDYLGQFDALVQDHSAAGDRDEVLGKFERESAPARASVSHDLDVLLAGEEQALDTSFVRLGHLAHLAELTIAIAAGLVLCLSLVLARRVQRKLTEQVVRIDRAREDARAEVERRQELLSIVSHDLRTPLHAVSLSAMLLEHVDHRERAIKAIASASERMNRLVDQLLDLSRVDSGVVALDIRRFDAADAVEEVARVLMPEADARTISLRIDLEACRVVADRERVLQILTNMASNALKILGDSGTVRLRVGPWEDRVRFEVIDNGPGIPADRIGKLFDRHFQGPEHRRGGLGLGLYICRKLVEAQRGTIGVASEVGKGCVFWFDLPADPSVTSS